MFYEGGCMNDFKGSHAIIILCNPALKPCEVSHASPLHSIKIHDRTMMKSGIEIICC